MKTRKDKRMIKLEFFFFKTALFKHIFKKPTHPHFGAWSFLLVHIWFTPSSKGPKAFVIFFRNRTMNVGASSLTMGNGHLTWSMV